VTDPAKPGGLEFQLGRNATLRRIAGKANNLTALLNPNSIAVMSWDRTATVDLAHIVSFASVSIPRLILR
jgi:hypothetical protein